MAAGEGHSGVAGPGRAVVVGAANVLAHVPGLCRHGSKPARVLSAEGSLLPQFTGSLRSYEEAVSYAPHQAYIGNLHPRQLPQRPWVGVPIAGALAQSEVGEILHERDFLGLLAAADDFGLVTLDETFVAEVVESLRAHPLLSSMHGIDRLEKAAGDVATACTEPGSLTLQVSGDQVVGAIRRAHDADEALAANVMLENLANKATGVLALLRLLAQTHVSPDSVDYVISCGEEAVGDRYQRGGGNMAKAIAETCSLTNASGADIKDFCAAPVPALVVAASLVASGVFRRVAVVAGGSLPKLGMKFQGHLKAGLPVLEDVLGGSAALVEVDDGGSPVIRLDAVGRHTVGHGGSNPQIMEALAIEPLVRLGLRTTDVEDFATELHNPEITEPQGAGDVAARNYRMIGALAARRGDIDRAEIDAFVQQRGMPGMAPTQGHLASAICYLPHALRRLTAGDAQRALFLAKGSLFLGRMCQLSDGMSVLLERNGGQRG